MVVEVYEAFSLVVSEKKTETIATPARIVNIEAIEIEAAGQKYTQIKTSVYLGVVSPGF